MSISSANLAAEPALPKTSCRQCGGSGVHVFARETHAHARLCPCVGECLRCAGSGRVRVSRDDGVVVGRCRCQQVPDRIQMFNRAAIPARYANATLVSFAQGANRVGDSEKSKAQAGVFQWLSGFDPNGTTGGIILHGPVGRGKTHLLVGILRMLIFDHGIAARFIEFSRLLSLLKEGYTKGHSDTGLLGALATAPVLGIDELGKGRLTDWELTIVDELVGRRYTTMGCTLATTNFIPGPPQDKHPGNLAQGGSTQSLGDRVGDRVFSRLREMCEFVEVGGLDFRALPSGP
jgi:DNA replication protein DnaC